MNVFYVACLMFAALFLIWASALGFRGLYSDYSGAPKTPVDGFPTPRIVPSTGPKRPDDSLGDSGIGDPPTYGFTSPAVVRCRPTVMPGDLAPDITVGPLQEAS